MATHEDHGEAPYDVQAILDSLNEGILTLDDAGRIVGMNRAACDTLGIAREKALMQVEPMSGLSKPTHQAIHYGQEP